MASTSGRPARTRARRAASSGCRLDDPSPSRTGTPASRTTSATRTARRSIAWSCGTATGRVSSGTTRRARSKRTSCASSTLETAWRWSLAPHRLTRSLILFSISWIEQNHRIISLADQYIIHFPLSNQPRTQMRPGDKPSGLQRTVMGPGLWKWLRCSVLSPWLAVDVVLEQRTMVKISIRSLGLNQP